jgi:hypothetical protein
MDLLVVHIQMLVSFRELLLSVDELILENLNGICWGPSASEGPQKHDLTMFSK